MMIAVTDHRYAAVGQPAAVEGAEQRKRRRICVEEKAEAAERQEKAAGAGPQNHACGSEYGPLCRGIPFWLDRPCAGSPAAAEKPVADPETDAGAEQSAPCGRTAYGSARTNCRSCAANSTGTPRFRAMAADDGPLVDAYRYLIDAADGLGRLLRPRQGGAAARYPLVGDSEITDAYIWRSLRAHVRLRAQRGVSRRASQRGVRARAASVPLPRLPLTSPKTPTMHGAGYPDALPLPEAIRRHRGVAHLRHRHGNRLARQRSDGGAGGRDLPGRPAELRDAGRARAPTPRTMRSADGSRWASCRWR